MKWSIFNNQATQEVEIDPRDTSTAASDATVARAVRNNIAAALPQSSIEEQLMVADALTDLANRRAADAKVVKSGGWRRSG